MRGIALVLVAQLSGCSFLFVERPPPQVPPGVWVSCTEGKAWPIVDAVIGTSMLLSAVGFGSSSVRSSSNGATDAALASGVDALVSVGVLYSAYAGFKWTNRCARQHEDAEARGIYGPTPPYPYPYPQPYPQPSPQPQPQGAPGGPP